MRDVAGVRLFMLRPDGLLREARTTLAVPVRAGSIVDVERVDRLRADEDRPGGGWTAETIGLFLARLKLDAPVHAAVLLAAARAGGFLRREEVYEIGEYDENRSLRGFVRPVSRLAQDFRDRGLVSPRTLDPLAVEYDEASSAGFDWPGGFRVPAEIVWLLTSTGAASGGAGAVSADPASASMSGLDPSPGASPAGGPAAAHARGSGPGAEPAAGLPGAGSVEPA
jgi:hypothetical protein